jgi:hypothetical protein
MAFPDSQATKTVSDVVVSAPITPLPRISQLGQKSEYAANDGSTKLTISHTTRSAASQRLVRFDQHLLVEDPLISGASRWVDHSAWVVLKSTSPLITVQDQVDLTQYLTGWLGENSFANAIKVLGGES